MPNYVEPLDEGAVSVSLIDRDPKKLNNHVQVKFDQLFGEPHGTHSPECVWKNSKFCFTCSKSCCYAFLTGLCSLLLSCCWAWQYACCACCLIWEHLPCWNLFNYCINCIRSYWEACLHCCVGVCRANEGYILSKIGVAFFAKE